MHHYVLALSGGLDSGVLLAHLLANAKGKIHPFLFRYGSKHNALEREAALSILYYYSTRTPDERRGEITEVDLGGAYGQSALTDSAKPVPEGHYSGENMRQTVVPGRNTLFLAEMLAYAESLEGTATIMLGVHAGDHHIYPDCRPAWVEAANKLARASSEDRVIVVAPFVGFDKAWIVKRGLELKFPFALTRTCYTWNEIACGKCGSCTERLEAFYKNDKIDPLAYQNGCPICRFMHSPKNGSKPFLPEPPKQDSPINPNQDVTKIPKAHDMIARFARVMENAAGNGKHLNPEIGNDLLNRCDTLARTVFKYDLFKDQPV